MIHKQRSAEDERFETHSLCFCIFTCILGDSGVCECKPEPDDLILELEPSNIAGTCLCEQKGFSSMSTYQTNHQQRSVTHARVGKNP